MIRLAMAMVLFLGLTVSASAAEQGKERASGPPLTTAEAAEPKGSAVKEPGTAPKPSVRRWSPNPASGRMHGAGVSQLPALLPPTGIPNF